jgi:uncharacterized damage-inducible protein DinB
MCQEEGSVEPFFADYLDRLEMLHADVQAAIQGLPQQALDWVPGPEMNSLSVLAVHLAGAERYWLGDVVTGQSSGRDRDAEFQVHGLRSKVLIERLADSLAYVRTVLSELSLQDLAQPHTSPRDGRLYTVGWALAHALEHTALHTGQIQLTRQLWDLHRQED